VIVPPWRLDGVWVAFATLNLNPVPPVRLPAMKGAFRASATP
jgi:hypothetical protein